MLRELVRVKEVGLVYRIMIVEDDRELRETLKELLILKNYDVITSGSVKEFDEHTDIYDMYLLDVKLPDGDGFDICERIRQRCTDYIYYLVR
jgi:two-component system response regulator RegX3